MNRMFSAIALVVTGIAIPAVVAANTPGEQVAGQIAMEAFAAVPFMQDPVLSPDGSKIVVTVVAKDQRAYAIISVDAGTTKPEIFAVSGAFKNRGDRDIFGYRWVGNDNVILTVVGRENIFGQRVDLSRLAGYNLTSKKLVDIAWEDATADASTVLHVDHEKSQILLSRQTAREGTERMFHPEVVRVDVASGKVIEKVVGTNPIIRGWYADGAGVVRMGVGYDRDTGKTRMLYRSNGSENFKTISNEADKDFTDAGISPSIFLAEPDMAIVTDNRSGFRKAYRMNLETMEIGEPVFSKDGYDIGGPISNAAGNAVDGYRYSTDRSYVQWTDDHMKEVQVGLDEEFGAGNATIISRSRDHKKLLVMVADASQPGSYYWYNTNTGDFRLLGYANATIKDGKVNPVKEMEFKASDGMSMRMMVTMPRHRLNTKNLPVVALVHGGPYGVRDYAEYDPWAQSIAELGYVVIQPNYRGSGGYGAEFLKAGRADGFGTRMQDDVNDAVDFLVGQGIVDPKRACIMGWSYGGYASARGAQRDPDRWRCAIAGAGVYDLQMMRTYDKDYLGSFGANYLAKGAADLDSVSPARNTKGKWSPILIVHGVRDTRVPVEQGRTLVKSLTSSGKVKGTNFDYIEQANNGHYGRFFTTGEGMEWLGGARDWLARFNPAYIDSDPDKAAK